MIENKNNKGKFYNLMMFPYPSGSAMHVGHASNYLYSEIIARFRRMQGYDVIFPLGYDSFGLPTENFAIKNNVSAQEATDNNIKYFEEQVAAMNFSLDKDRMLRTSDPEYYKWTQWIFEKLFEHGLVYRKDGFVNRDPIDQTVLANDQVLPDGTAERSGAVVIQKRMSQWYIKITDYAEQLLDYSDCERPEETITHQKNWIGKSEGAEIDFDIYIGDKGDNLTPKIITVFTTRPDTIYGVTAIVIAPENEILDIYISEDKKAELAEYRRVTSLKTNIERQSTDKEKTGFDSGVVVIHPLTGEKVPVWFADYVLPDYATGAVMFVPAHDVRDWEFAKKFGINAIDVIAKHYVGGNKPVEGKKNTVREIVICVLYNEDMSKIAVLDRKTTNYKSFVQGGIENSESSIESGLREIIEETGYEDIEHIYTIPGQIHAEFFAAHKDVNRYAIAFGNVYKLESSKNNNDRKDVEHHDLLWIDVSEVEKFFGQVEGENDSLIFWQRYLSDNQAFTGQGKLVNSGQFDGLDNINAKTKITEYLESINKGRKKITYRLRDRSVSRQRYRGSPIPVYYTFAENEQVPFFENKQELKIRTDKKTESRINAIILAKHRSEDKYLTIDWEENFGTTLPTGGIDGGENTIQAAIREFIEETGYNDIQTSSELLYEVHTLFFAPHKDINRYMIQKPVFLQLGSDSRIDQKLESHEKFTINRLSKEELLSNIKYGNQLYILKKYLDPNATPDVPEYISRYNAYNPHPDKSKRIPNLIPETDLPVVLPLDLPNYKPAGKSPLEDHSTFKYYHAPDGNIYLRECDTLDTFMCSSFYYLRFLDPKNTERLISPEAQKNMPVDLYIGGKEHTVGHLLYSRFIYKFLRDKGYISNPSKEPFRKLVHQGMVSAADGRKMSKRRGNVIDPMDTIRQYGADTLRTYIMFMGPIELNKNWNPEAVAGINKFLERVRRASDFVDKGDSLTSELSENQIQSFTHIAIKGITEDLENLKFNTAISKLMILLNHIYDLGKVDKANWENFLILLSPFATEITQELRSKLGHDTQISEQSRPERKSEYISAMPTKLAIQINGKMRGILEVEKGLSQEAALELIKSSGEFDKYLSGEIKKVIYVQDKICNLIIG